MKAFISVLVLGLLAVTMTHPFTKKCLCLDKPFCCPNDPCHPGYECVSFCPNNKTIPHPDNIGVCLKKGCCNEPTTTTTTTKKHGYYRSG